MNILLVTQWFPPEPARMAPAIARSLRGRGHEVSVLTGIPNYPTGVVQAGYSPYRFGSEIVDGFATRRTPLYPSHDRSAANRILNYMSWAISSAVGGIGSLRRADVCLVYSSPATAAFAPALWGRLTKTPFVLHIQDLWPDSVTSSGMLRGGSLARVLASALSRFVTWTYKRSAHIVVISPGMKNLLASRGVPPEKISLVYNWTEDDTGDANASDRQKARAALGIEHDGFVLGYAGNHGPAQALDVLLESASRLQESHPDVRCVLAGFGVLKDDLERRADELGLTNVRFLGHLDSHRMREFRAACDVQYVGLVGDPVFAVTMPSKIQSILASGLPVIAAVPGDAAAVVARAEAGWVVEPGAPSLLAGAIGQAAEVSPSALRAMGSNARQYYLDHMSEETGGRLLSDVLHAATKS